MSILNILIYPNKKLRKKTKIVQNFNVNLKKQIYNMFETMYFNKGIGLAATQVNINKSIIVIDISEKKNKKIVLINPIVIKKYGKIKLKEGCLSIPNFSLVIRRSNFLKIKTFNMNGKQKLITSNGLLSVCIQHEIDHLNGKLLIDHIK